MITLNNIQVIQGTIHLPLKGVWSADLVLDNPDGAGFNDGTQVTLVADNGLTLTGVIAPNRSGSFLDASHVRVLGGAGGMAKLTQPRYYASPGAFARDVTNSMLADAGEALSSQSDSSFLSTSLSAWLVMQQPTSSALENLVDTIAPGSNWRVLADGSVWIGAETWPSMTVSDAVTLKQDPTEGSYDLGVDGPAIIPGVFIDGIGNVGRVQHQIQSGKLRTIVWTYMPEAERGIKASVGSLVAQATAHIDYFALYVAEVVSQSADGSTVDVQPNDRRLPGMSKVPLRFGLPGIVAKFAPGAYVLVGWDGGDPSKPYAGLWGGGETVTQLQLGGTHPAPLFDTFYTDLVAWIGVLNTLLGTLVPGTGATGGPAYASAIALPTSFITKMAVPTNYQSQVVSNG